MDRTLNNLKQCVKTKPVTFIVLGFLSGLLLMYVILLDKINRFGNASITESKLENDISEIQEYLSGIESNGSMSFPTAFEPHVDMSFTETTSTTRNASWTDTQNHRRSLLTKVCESFHLPSNPSIPVLRNVLLDNENILVDPRHEVIYCAIPKAACSSWRAALSIMTNKFPNMRPGELPSRIHSPIFLRNIGLPSPVFLANKQFSKSVTDFTKFLVVRHPLERLVSAYRDKFQTYNKWTRHFQMKYGRKIVSFYRGKNASTDSQTYGHDVTFTEFLTFILDDSIRIEDRRNPHWDTYQSLCHPCLVGYDHVVKFETLAIDNDEILSRYFSVKDSGKFFPRRNVKNTPSKDIMAQYYSAVPATLFQKVYAHFRTDMEMFGYTLPEQFQQHS